jgi:ribonuclease E
LLTESLRPPAEVESTQTKGRKSHKPAGTTGRKKAAASGIVADEDDVKGEDPAVVENVDGTEHAELGPDAKAEEHACPSPVKKKRAPKKVKLEADGEEKAMPVPKKRAPRKTKANAEPVDQVLAELPAPPEAMDAPILDAAEQAGVAAAEPSPAKKRKTTRKGKAAAAAVPAGCANADVDADVESKADEDLPVVRPRAKRTASGKAKAAH